MSTVPEPAGLLDESARPSRILIVDDEPQNRALLEVMLKVEGFVFESASSGEEALAAIAAQPPDLVLLDVMMPGMDGIEVAAKIKGAPATQDIPIIMVTSLEDRDFKMLGLNAGADGVLTKPVDRAELCVRVRNLLKRKAHGDDQEGHSQALEAEVDRRTADLADSEALYRSTFDAAPVGIANVALDGRWLRVNQRLCDLLGYTAEELLGSRVQALVRSEEAPGEAESFRQMAAGALDRHVIDERRYRRRDQTFVWARVNRSVHRDAAGQPAHCILVIEDITDWRALEEQIRQAGKMDSIGRLAAGVAHDFNNLLSVILTYAEMGMRDVSPGEPLWSDLQEIKGAGERAAGLTRQLLAFSRQQVLILSSVNLDEVVRGAEKMLRLLAGEAIELAVTPVADLGLVWADSGQLEQVLMNLVVNARDAMPHGGKVTVETSNVQVTEEQSRGRLGAKPGPHVMLAVRDDGEGMDAATKSRIFEPFFTTKGVGKGTGLGLATVFGIVDQVQRPHRRPERAWQGHDVRDLPAPHGPPARSGQGGSERAAPSWAAPRPSSSSKTKVRFEPCSAVFSAASATGSSRPGTGRRAWSGPRLTRAASTCS